MCLFSSTISFRMWRGCTAEGSILCTLAKEKSCCYDQNRVHFWRLWCPKPEVSTTNFWPSTLNAALDFLTQYLAQTRVYPFCLADGLTHPLRQLCKLGRRQCYLHSTTNCYLKYVRVLKDVNHCFHTACVIWHLIHQINGAQRIHPSNLEHGLLFSCDHACSHTTFCQLDNNSLFTYRVSNWLSIELVS